MSQPFFSARVHTGRAHFTVRASVEAPAGSVVGVVGPNGAGKSTLVQALAGLLPLHDSHIRVGTAVWHEDRTARIPTRKRRLGLVSQQPRLFPHLDVRANVAFGLRRQGVPRREATAAADSWLEQVGLDGLGRRAPDELSGGQQQRAALARALATAPDLLLLDEPFVALDIASAQQMRTVLRDRLAAYEGVAVLVTHDPIDALTLTDHLLVLDDGQVTQSGTPWQVASHPMSSHAARLVGLNVLAGQGEGHEVVLPGGRRVETAQPCEGPTQVTLPPSAITLATAAPLGSARNRWEGHVVALAPLGQIVRVELDVGFRLLADVLPESVHELGLTRGSPVWASAKATEVRVLTPVDDPSEPLG